MAVPTVHSEGATPCRPILHLLSPAAHAGCSSLATDLAGGPPYPQSATHSTADTAALLGLALSFVVPQSRSGVLIREGMGW